jgi:hypothetical protein
MHSTKCSNYNCPNCDIVIDECLLKYITVGIKGECLNYKHRDKDFMDGNRHFDFDFFEGLAGVNTDALSGSITIRSNIEED